MEACKEFLKSKGLAVIKVFRVPSRSEKGKFHIVQLFGDRHLECSCVAGGFKQPCRHKKIVAEKLAKKRL